jgi:uncharacterized integral membrane protein
LEKFQLQVIFALSLLVAIVVAIVALQNATPVSLTLLFFEITTVPLSLLILSSVAVGALLMMILSLGGRIRSRNASRERDKTIARVQAELAGERARSVPATVAPDASLPEAASRPAETETL